MSQLVLLRHGQSEWNAENRFTGFVDVGLTDLGREEARKGGRALAGMRFDRAFSSTLRRAIETTEIALAESGSNEHLRRDGGWNITCHDDLRERDYGELAGLNKAETAEKFGAEQVHIWRRSYDVAPPGGESLKDVVSRAGRYYEAEIAPCLAQGKAVLVGAHGNTVRALLVALGCHDPAEIPNVEIPTGVPMLFEVTDGKPGAYRFLQD